MFILVFILSMSSITEVWLVPTTVANSELASPLEDDETRSKRQSAIYERLQQAVEKYGNFADEQPISLFKDLHNFKQYENSLTQAKEITAAINRNESKTNLTCAKVNLCFIQDQTAGSHKNLPATNSPINFSNQHLEYPRAPLYGFGSIPGYLQYNFARNHAIFNRFLHGLTTTAHSLLLTKNNTEEKITGSSLPNTTLTPGEIRYRSCSNHKNKTNKKNEIADYLLSSRIIETKIRETVKNCSCSNSSGPTRQNINTHTSTLSNNSTRRAETDQLLAIRSDKELPTSKPGKCNCPKRSMLLQKNQNLNFLKEDNNSTINTATQERSLAGAKLPEILQQTQLNIKNIEHSCTNQHSIKSTTIDPSDVNEDFVGSATRAPALQSHITTKDLDHIRGKINNLLFLFANKSAEANRSIKKESDQNIDKIKYEKTEQRNVSATNENPLTRKWKSNIANTHINVPELDTCLQQLNESDSKVTISFKSNGRIKKIQLEHQFIENGNKKLESNRNGNLNMTPYAEPIVSEINSEKLKFRTKPPLTIYWHKIEERQPLQLRAISNEMCERCQLDDTGNYGSDYVENHSGALEESKERKMDNKDDKDDTHYCEYAKLT